MWQPISTYKAQSQAQSQPAAPAPPAPAPTQPAPTPSPAQSHPETSARDATPTPLPGNPSVRRCCAAYQKAVTAHGGSKNPGARDAGAEAYRLALPDLTGRASTADFIACIVKGMLIRVFWNDEGPRLIIAAKAALAALPPEPRNQQQTDPGNRMPPRRKSQK
ncbi:MAG TPA: hypothetical protein VGL22_13875 [Terracidiphilus sp.]